jgi:cytoskeletal protein CcmA (bactofilin family)
LKVIGITTTDSLEVTNGTSTKNLKVTGIATFDQQVNIVNLNVSGVGTFGNIELEGNTVSTTTGNLILDSASGTTRIDDTLYINDATESDDKDSGSIYTEGGVGIEKNLNVGGQLNILGISTLASNGGITTTGGDLYVKGSLYVKDDVFYDELFARNGTFTGIVSTKYLNVSGVATIATLGVTGLTTTRDLSVTGFSTFTGFIDANGGAYIDNIRIGITNDNTIDTSSGNLTLNSAGGTTTISSKLIVSDTATFNTTVTLGNDTSDVVNFTSKVATSILPSTTNLNLGGSSNRWDTVYANTFEGRLSGYASSIAVSSDSSNLTRYLPFVDVTAGLSTVRTNSALAYNPSTNILTTTNLTVSGISSLNNLSVSGVTTLGDANTDTVNFNARVGTGITPTTGSHNLGGSSNRWDTVYANTFEGRLSGYASSIAVSSDSTNLTRYLPFVDTTSGLSTVRTNSSLSYNPSTNILATSNLAVSGISSLNNLSVSGVTTIGNAFSDTVYINGAVGTGITPTTNATSSTDVNGKDLGGTSNYWRKIYAKEFVGAIAGNADSATRLATPRNIGITGDLTWSVNFDGSGNVSSGGTLANSGVTSNTYGSATTVPVFAVDAKGRVTSVTNTTINVSGATVSKADAATQLSPRSSSPYTTIDTQGSYIHWNRNNGDGSTWLINQKGGGGGGFLFAESTSSALNVNGGTVGLTTTLKLDSSGNITGFGLLTIPSIKPTGIQDTSGGTGTDTHVLTANGSGGWSWKVVGNIGGASASIAVSSDSSNLTRYLPFVDIISGITTVRTKSTLVYNPSGIGSVGIATTNPKATLDVGIGSVYVSNGDIHINGTPFVFNTRNSTGGFWTNGGIDGVGNVNNYTPGGRTGFAVKLPGGSAGSFGAPNGNDMINVLTASYNSTLNTGVVGIGTTIPIQTLHVQGSTYISGNLGIGITTPTTTLQVAGDVTPSVTNTYNLGSSTLKWGTVYANTFSGSFTGTATTSSSVSVSADSSNNLRYITFADSTTGVSTLRTNSSLVYNPSGIGSVGIATNNPKATLDVGSGNLRISSGDVVVNGTLFLSNTRTSGGGFWSNGGLDGKVDINNVTPGGVVGLSVKLPGGTPGTIDSPQGTGSMYRVLSVAFDNALSVGIVSVQGHILPSITDTYNLGSSDSRWNDFYVNDIIGAAISGADIYSNGVTTTSGPLQTAVLQADGNIVSYRFTSAEAAPNNTYPFYCYGIRVDNIDAFTTEARADKITISAQNNRDLELYTNTGAIILSPNGTAKMVLNEFGNLGIGTTNPIAKLAVMGNIRCNRISPNVSDSYSCGADGLLWTAVWATNGTIQPSDQREKTNITPSNLGLNFIQKLNPVSYKWIDGGNTSIQDENGNEVGIISHPGKRTHYGLLSQEVKTAFNECGAEDFAGWVLTDLENPDSQQALNYSQFISPMIKAIQEQQETINQLTTTVTSLLERIELLENPL